MLVDLGVAILAFSFEKEKKFATDLADSPTAGLALAFVVCSVQILPESHKRRIAALGSS